MVEPEKPFACGLPNCGMTFTNEDRLNVHTKKHDMELQLGLEQKSTFVADQTPTPTRFIRNCEEMGLFQDLQNVNVNPFDEDFKQAMEAKSLLSLENAIASDDALHTPQMVFPNIDAGDSALFTATNNQQNVTISRSLSDETGTVKEYERTTISKLTNEVTTISRTVDKVTTDDAKDDIQKDIVNGTSVSYTNNVIKIHSNVEIRKDGTFNAETSKPITLISYKDSVIKDATSVVTKDVLITDNKQVPDQLPPIMSQKSIDFVIDSLTSECHKETDKDKDVIKMVKRNYVAVKKPDENTKLVTKVKDNSKDSEKVVSNEDYEVIIKLPNGKRVRMKAVEETSNTNTDKINIHNETKEKLKKVLSDKVDRKTQNINRLTSIDAQVVQNLVPITTGALFPVTIVNPTPILLTNSLQKIPILPLNLNKFNNKGNTPYNFKAVKRKARIDEKNIKNNVKAPDGGKETERDSTKIKRTEQSSNFSLENRSAASRRYRERLKVKMRRQSDENKQLKDSNQRLKAENTALKVMINEHIKKCPKGDDLKIIVDKLPQIPS